MHYKPREKPPKVLTEKFVIDAKLIDLLEITSIRFKKSKNQLFELALLKTCKETSIKSLTLKRKRKKYLVEQETLDLLEKKCKECGLTKNALVNKSLKDFLTDKYLQAFLMDKRYIFKDK